MDKQTDMIAVLNEIYEEYQEANENYQKIIDYEEKTYMRGLLAAKTDSYKNSWQLIATAVLGTRHDAEPYNITGNVKT